MLRVTKKTPCPRAQLGKMYPNSTDPSEPVWSRGRKLREIPEQREDAQSAEGREDTYPQGVRPETIIFFCYLAWSLQRREEMGEGEGSSVGNRINGPSLLCFEINIVTKSSLGRKWFI